MTEADISRKQMKALREAALEPKLLFKSVAFKHWQHVGSGTPDVSVTWAGLTTWVELKYLKHGLISRGIQRLMIEKLAAAGSCFYLLFSEEETAIVSPHQLDEYLKTGHMARKIGEPFDYQLIVNFIREWHLLQSECGHKEPKQT